MSDKNSSDYFKGWLWKWTNYIKGYQRRWFVLSNGLLSYYRSQAEMAHTCRGTINLGGAFINTEDSCNFVVSNGDTQTFHLKASSEVERQRWVTALELAKTKASQLLDSDDGSFSDEGDMVIIDPGDRPNDSHANPPSDFERIDIFSTLRTLANKLDDLETCNDLISKHGVALQGALSELEIAEGQTKRSTESPALTSKVKTVNERATLFRITSTAMINACSEFLNVAHTNGKRWHKAIIHEREQRIRLQDTVEALAKQHNTLERAIQGDTGPPRSGAKEAEKREEVEEEASDEDEEFVDALDTTYSVEVVPGHKKTFSTASNQSSSLNLRDEPPESKDIANSTKKKISQKKYRTSIPEKPNYSLNLWSIMKNCIGKDLSKIPMPVNFNEPLSFLQRLGEDLEYSSLLQRAAKCTSSQEQMAYIIAFSVSTYASTLYRTGKPFNPLLGESYECDRRDDLGFRMICEQVSHHPPIAAMHVESVDVGPQSGWSYWTEISLASKFRGKYLNVNPLGRVHVKFHATGHHYTWSKVTTTVHNIIVGKLWVDQSGDAEIINHKTGDYCKHKYFPYSYFSRETPRKVSGIIMDKNNKAYYVVSGTWDSHMDCAKIDSVNNANKSKPLYKTHQAKRLWQKNSLPIKAEKTYFFSTFALTLNQEEPGVAPTDSRLRPDQRFMEEGSWDKANEMKLLLEDAQRKRRRHREAEAAAKKAAGQDVEPYRPMWFVQKTCEHTGDYSFVSNGKYWQHKEKQEWKNCIPIFDVSST